MIEKIYLATTRCAAIYNGANGAEIVAEFRGVVVDDDGVTLRYADEGYDPVGTPTWPVYEATVGQFVRWDGPGGEAAAQPALAEPPPFPSTVVYSAADVDALLAALAARVTALETP